MSIANSLQFGNEPEPKDQKHLIPKLTKFGGTQFLESTTVVQGAPKPNPKPSELLTVQDYANKFQWQYRVIQAMRAHPKHTCAWITLTYAEPEPPTWIAARRDLSTWLKQLKDFHRRVILPARHLFCDVDR